MSASNEYTEWHLTDQGWVRGTEKEDFKKTSIVDRPENALLTMKYSEYMSSPFSPLEKRITEIFRSEDSLEIERLLEVYGNCPSHL